MTIFEAIILGIVQGLTEFIPVSSSGHLVIFHELLGVQEDGLAFDVALHIGTLMALIIYFYKDIGRLVKAVFVHSSETKVAWLLALATIPAVFSGILLQNLAEDTFRSVRLVAFNLLLLGLLMLSAEWYARRNYKKPDYIKDIKTSQALAMGLAQAAAVIPGVSRSGSTITAGIFTGLNRVAATRFAFLLGIPITLGAIIKVLSDSENQHLVGQESGVFLAGILAAFLSGIVAIRFMLKYLSKHGLHVFAYYRIALALIVLVAAAF
jgi:undecaprenyl-diphosphatase